MMKCGDTKWFSGGLPDILSSGMTYHGSDDGSDVPHICNKEYKHGGKHRDNEGCEWD